MRACAAAWESAGGADATREGAGGADATRARLLTPLPSKRGARAYGWPVHWHGIGVIIRSTTGTQAAEGCDAVATSVVGFRIHNSAALAAA